MSEELKQAISALQCAKRGHCDHAMADEAIAALERALTQRPAAQAEREAFESRVTLNSIIKQYRIKAEDAHWLRASLPTQPAAQDEREADEVFLPRRLAATQKLTQLGYRYDSAHGKWLPTPQQATPEPVGEVFGYFRALPFGWEQCGEHDDGAVALYDRPAPGVPEEALAVAEHIRAKAATPEPVGEVFQFHPMPEGWPARFRCESCDGNGEIGELVSMGHFQPPERQTCPDCGGRGWTSEEHAFNADHMREFAEAHALLTRPAPGVPEGFALVPVEPTLEMLKAMESQWLVGSQVDMANREYAAMLAAAQAKGGQ